MKRMTAIIIIALCLLASALPAMAAQDGAARADGNNRQNDDGPGQNDAAGKARDTAGTDETKVRETIQKEVRAENRTENRAETPALNRTGERLETREELRLTGTPDRNATGERGQVRVERTAAGAIPGNATPARAGWTKNPNEVRLAVHTLLAMENLTGGIGTQVSSIARDFNNSAQKTWQLEARIESRDAFSRFLFGGDRASAAELAGLTVQNENRIRQIEQLVNDGTLDSATRAMLEEQLRILEAENTRLGQLSELELQDRGLLGWIGG
jgi:hypothetical protein